MKDIHGVSLIPGSNEELLPDFFPDFPYIASRTEMIPGGNTGVPWHWHHTVELFYVESGTLEYTTPEGKQLFPAGWGGQPDSVCWKSGSWMWRCATDSTRQHWTAGGQCLPFRNSLKPKWAAPFMRCFPAPRKTVWE